RNRRRPTAVKDPMLRSLLLLVTLLSALAWLPSASAAMDMRDYNLLDIGMSLAEVEVRVGPPDRETVYGYGDKIIWYYLPDSQNGWITEIIFNSGGRVNNLKRYKP
ncbi:MAG: hypothetical protein L0H37_11385, partial [Nitrosospira sp.]|nr:hypothetical protein [Nitrosospira sp.]